MDKESFFYLGKIIKPYGTKNEFLAILETSIPGHYKNLDTIFVEINKTYIPYFINKIKISGKQAVIELKDIEFEVILELLTGSSIFLPKDFLPKSSGNKFYSHEVKGFSVNDKTKGNIGIIEDIIELNHHPLLKIKFRSKEILIPVVDEIIKKVDRKKKQINIDAPDGLIDIYI